MSEENTTPTLEPSPPTATATPIANEEQEQVYKKQIKELEMKVQMMELEKDQDKLRIETKNIVGSVINFYLEMDQYLKHLQRLDEKNKNENVLEEVAFVRKMIIRASLSNSKTEFIKLLKLLEKFFEYIESNVIQNHSARDYVPSSNNDNDDDNDDSDDNSSNESNERANEHTNEDDLIKLLALLNLLRK